MEIDIFSLASIYPDLSKLGPYLSESACVCLQSQNHEGEASLRVHGDIEQKVMLRWEQIDVGVYGAYGDTKATTEHGAYALALLIVHNLTNWKYLSRSAQGTGFDFYLDDKPGDPMFQGKCRLEVSGIADGTQRAVTSRVRSKVKQVNAHNSPIPKLIIVVEFSEPQSCVKK